MSITSFGLQQLATQLMNNSKLDLLDTQSSPISTLLNYASVTCKVPEEAPTGTTKNQADFYIVPNGNNSVKIKNYLFYFQDADNGTSNTTGTPNNVWVVHGIRLTKNSSIIYEDTFSQDQAIPQFYRPKFKKDDFQITITSSDNTNN